MLHANSFRPLAGFSPEWPCVSRLQYRLRIVQSAFLRQLETPCLNGHPGSPIIAHSVGTSMPEEPRGTSISEHTQKMRRVHAARWVSEHFASCVSCLERSLLMPPSSSKTVLQAFLHYSVPTILHPPDMPERVAGLSHGSFPHTLNDHVVSSMPKELLVGANATHGEESTFLFGKSTAELGFLCGASHWYQSYCRE